MGGSAGSAQSTGGTAASPRPPETREALWPAEDVSPWFRGVFWDDLLFILSADESTLSVLALTSG